MQDGVTVHRQLHQLVTEHLRTAILDGDLQPGEWLRQQRIADELGVSQMPVREALKALAAEGVVEYIPYRGARVVEFSSEDVADLYAQR
ncbi:MAG: GntR family transcriptional regulator, partial [Anaerolineae bacterium]